MLYNVHYIYSMMYNVHCTLYIFNVVHYLWIVDKARLVVNVWSFRSARANSADNERAVLSSLYPMCG